MIWLRFLAWTTTALVAVSLIAVGLGAWRWARMVDRIDASLTQDPGAPRRDDPPSLPTVVVDYLRRSIPSGSSAVRVVELEQAGTFRLGDGPDGWREFTALELFRMDPPGFYWDARIEMAPFVTVRVLDSYDAGHAAMVGRIGGVIPVVNQVGGEALARGALARYLAEAVWFPTRLASTGGLEWRAVDERRAEATLSDGPVSVSLTFTFDDGGDVVGVSGMRPREVDGGFIETPWLGRFAQHREVEGFRIPTYGEVAWVVDEVDTPYWRGTIVAARSRPLIPPLGAPH